MLIATLFYQCGCTKSSSSSSTTGSGKAFYCKIDGTDYTPAGGGRWQTLSGAIPGIQIIGDTSFTTMEIYVPSDAVGTYDLNHTGASNFATVYVNASNREFLSTGGEVKITKSAGGKISGTFHFSAADSAGTMTITSGEFNDIPKI